MTGTSPLGPVEVVEQIDSTNAELLRRARAGAPEGQVLVARHQTAGRGRLDRRWTAPPGASLLVSVLLRPRGATADVHLVTMAAALAAVAACAEVTGVDVAVKWPNDVVHEGPEGTRKLAGLLAEGIVAGGAVEAVVVGMGFNLHWREALPDGGIDLAGLVDGPVDGDALLAAWLDGLASRLAVLPTLAGRDGLRDELRTRCATLGRRVVIETPAGAEVGVATDVDQQGRLVLDGDPNRAFAVGDVVHLRSDVG